MRMALQIATEGLLRASRSCAYPLTITSIYLDCNRFVERVDAPAFEFTATSVTPRRVTTSQLNVVTLSTATYANNTLRSAALDDFTISTTPLTQNVIETV